MRAKRSLVQIYLISLVALSAIPLAVLGYIWIAKEYESYTQQSQEWRDSYIESRRELLRREVDKAVEYLEFRRNQLNRQLYLELRQQIAIGLSLIENTRKEYVGESRRAQINRLRTTLASLSFQENNKGFFFLFDAAGNAVLPPVHPDGEMRLEDKAVLEAFARQIQQVTKEKNFEFIEYRFTRPDGADTARNFSFVYHYKPLDIYLGASLYLRDEIARTQREVIERIAAVPVDPNNSILFLVDKQGRQLVNAYDPDSVGESMPGVIEAGKRLGQEEDSLFTELSWTDKQGDSKPVVSYLRQYEPWGWTLGSGVFLDQLNERLSAERAQLQNRVREHIAFIIAIALGLMVVSAVAAQWLARRSASGFTIFQQFFADASKKSTAIDINRLPFAEFQRLAEDANYMVEKRTETEQALKLSERRFHLALDAAQNHLWDLDLTTGYVTVSDSFFRMLGYEPPADPYPVGAYKYVACPDDLQIIASAVDSWLGLATGNSVEFRIKDRSGRYHWIYSRGDVVEIDMQDKPTRAMGIMIDITERKRMEQDLVDARIAAEDALHAKSQFLSSVSHELRTPLNGVLGYAQLLQRESGLPSGSQEYLRAIESCGKHLLNLINDVLDLAKIESGNINIVCQPTYIDEVITNVGDIVAHRARGKGLDFVVDLDDLVPKRLQLDEVKLRQVLVNLLDNAVKFTDHGSVHLKITADFSNNQLDFSVTDTGVGIPEEAQRDVFEPFKQVNPQDGKGTGLGLSICRRLVEAMGGSLNLRSRVGHGSCFYFDIPLMEVAEEEAPKALARDVEGDLPSDKIIDNPAIIVADDVAVNRQVLAGMLSDVTDDIREAANGREVIDLLKDRTANLVLMDLRMPVMDGLAATRLIKHELKMHDVHVIMASAATDDDLMAEAIRAGCDGFLPKPIGMDELFRVLAETCGAEPLSAEEVEAPVTQELELAGPPEAIRQALTEAAELGDITALREQLNTLRQSHPECDAFSDEAEAMLADFDFGRLLKLLQRQVEGASLNDA